MCILNRHLNINKQKNHNIPQTLFTLTWGHWTSYDIHSLLTHTRMLPSVDAGGARDGKLESEPLSHPRLTQWLQPWGNPWVQIWTLPWPCLLTLNISFLICKMEIPPKKYHITDLHWDEKEQHHTCIHTRNPRLMLQAWSKTNRCKSKIAKPTQV